MREQMYSREVIAPATVQRWIEKLGYEVTPTNKSTLRVRPSSVATLPPFYIQCGENWVMLSMLPVFRAGDAVPDDLWHRLLMVNRDMRVAKFALGEDDEVVLCAELPTEALDYAELADAATRMVDYYRHYREFLLGP